MGTPTRADTLTGDGVEIYYEVCDNDGSTIVLIPPSPITCSRIYKRQIPCPSRHYRVVAPDKPHQHWIKDVCQHVEKSSSRLPPMAISW